MTKMTIDEVRALVPSVLEPTSITANEATEAFCWHGAHRSEPSSLSDDLLMTLLMGSIGVANQSECLPYIVAYADAVAHEIAARIDSPKAALAWLLRNEQVARTYLVARLFCPKGKKLADLYCLPKSAVYQGKSIFRLLVVPTSRGRVIALVGDEKKSRKPGIAWWYMSNEDVWDLRCKCCPRPDGGVRAGDFLEQGRDHGYTAVLV